MSAARASAYHPQRNGIISSGLSSSPQKVLANSGSTRLPSSRRTKPDGVRCSLRCARNLQRLPCSLPTLGYPVQLRDVTHPMHSCCRDSKDGPAPATPGESKTHRRHRKPPGSCARSCATCTDRNRCHSGRPTGPSRRCSRRRMPPNEHLRLSSTRR